MSDNVESHLVNVVYYLIVEQLNSNRNNRSHFEVEDFYAHLFVIPKHSWILAPHRCNELPGKCTTYLSDFLIG